MTKKITKTENIKMNPQKNLSAELRNKLKSCDLEVQNYVTELESENLKLQKKIAKYQVQEISLNNRIKSLIENKSEEDRNLQFQLIANIKRLESLKKTEPSGTNK